MCALAVSFPLARRALITGALFRSLAQHNVLPVPVQQQYMMYHRSRSQSVGKKTTGSSSNGGGYSSDNDGESDNHPVMSQSSLMHRAQREHDSGQHEGATDTADGKELGTGADPGPERNGDNETNVTDQKKNNLSQRPVCLVVGAGPGIGTSVAARFAREVSVRVSLAWFIDEFYSRSNFLISVSTDLLVALYIL